MIKTVIFDIDDTLYSFMESHAAAFAKVCGFAQENLGIPAEVFRGECNKALSDLTAELVNQAALHERTIRFLRVLEKYRKPLGYAPILDDLYWNTFLERSQPAPGIRDCMAGLKQQGYKVGICTNMTLKWQIKKVDALGLLEFVDFFVASEEAGADKPDPAPFALCARKAGCTPKECLFIGDSLEHDMQGAENLGMRTLWYTRGRENPQGRPAFSHYDEVLPLLCNMDKFPG